MCPLKITLVQTNIAWEDKTTNLTNVLEKIEALRGTTDLVVLPEMFSTGFDTLHPQAAEPVTGPTLTALKALSARCRFAIAGSVMTAESARYHNRAFFITPEGETFYYDKHHLFRAGNEHQYFSPGALPKPIISYRGWNICLLVCYDLRFPVWSRNINNEYDLLIYVANWPTPRRHAWDILLQARAIENMCFVCGVNRVGVDGNNLSYNGGSALYSPKGLPLAIAPDNEETTLTAPAIDLAELQHLRTVFPVWQDADAFQLLPPNIT